MALVQPFVRDPDYTDPYYNNTVAPYTGSYWERLARDGYDVDSYYPTGEFFRSRIIDSVAQRVGSRP